MALLKKEVDELRSALEHSARPLFIFDGDTDGLCSFSLLYRFRGEGKGVIVSGRPLVTIDFARKIEEYQPDAVFILDLAEVSQEFLDRVNTPLYWLDHHDPNHEDLRIPKNVHYYNPRMHDDSDNRPTTFWAYQVVKKYIWVAMIGVIADYHFLLADEFRKEFPELLPKEIDNPSDALFKSPVGEIVKILEFNLKGGIQNAMTSIKIFTRIESPIEILDQTTSRGKYLVRRAKRIQKPYDALLADVCAEAEKGEKLVAHIYEDDRWSLSGNLANEVKAKFPKQVVIIGRKHDGRVIMSLRSDTIEVLGPLKKSLEGLTDAHGGGHPLACGASVMEEEYDTFLEKFKRALHTS